MRDPRLAVIERRLEPIRHIVAVTGGKGGIGKTLVASTLALNLSRAGANVGLFDLDFTGPSTHVVLGAEPVLPVEDRGIVPPRVHGIAYLSVVHYARDHPSPLRGADVSNALVELLAITRWGALDTLILDMPPGIGDATLDAARYLQTARYLLVTTPSKMALGVSVKMAKALVELGRPVIGAIENMARDGASSVAEAMAPLGIAVLGRIRYDATIEEALGFPDRLLETAFNRDLSAILAEITLFRTSGAR